MFYKILVRPILFLFSAERAHTIAMILLKFVCAFPGGNTILRILFGDKKTNPGKVVAGIRFPNPVGLAAGFDKDAKAFDELSELGFGFIEIGTVTPIPQEGNPKPRLFRLPADQALINRMGFNNDGVKAAAKRLASKKNKDLIIGGNIGKNKATLNEEAEKDYLICFQELFPYVDYFVINISSPNTPGLRELQEKEPLMKLLAAVQSANKSTGNPKPVFLKIAPDLTSTQVDDIISIVTETGLAGMVISNTTLSRESLHTSASQIAEIGAGGLSGKPLFDSSTALLKYIFEKTNGRFALIASGGVFSAEDAQAKLNAGADLVQLYTGFIYEGPGLIKKIKKSLSRS